MSLYNVQKFLYELNRDERVQQAYRTDRDQAIAGYDLDAEEQGALVEPDIGLLYHLGVNGQILMHFAAFCGIEWSDYLQRLSDGVERHGPVRAGVYALAGYEGVAAHSTSLGHSTDADLHTSREQSQGHSRSGDADRHRGNNRSTSPGHSTDGHRHPSRSHSTDGDGDPG